MITWLICVYFHYSQTYITFLFIPDRVAVFGNLRCPTVDSEFCQYWEGPKLYAVLQRDTRPWWGNTTAFPDLYVEFTMLVCKVLLLLVMIALMLSINHWTLVFQTYIGLDDFEFKNCVPEAECVSSSDFQCYDGSCIPYQYACDEKYDCPDKSDEYQCEKVLVRKLCPRTRNSEYIRTVFYFKC